MLVNSIVIVDLSIVVDLLLSIVVDLSEAIAVLRMLLEENDPLMAGYPNEEYVRSVELMVGLNDSNIDI